MAAFGHWGASWDCDLAMLRRRNDKMIGPPMTDARIAVSTEKTAAELALEALDQAFEYYTPTPVLVKAEDEPVEYYEYAAAA